MTHTLKTRLLFWFILFSVLSVMVVIIINTTYFRNRERVNTSITELTELKLMFLQDFKSVDQFFNIDAVNNDFYQTNKSRYLEKHSNFQRALTTEISRLSNIRYNRTADIEMDFDELKIAMAEYEVILSQLIETILERGFKDDGIMGEMRYAAHLLEEYDQVDMTVVLSLRRHEKDYIIRNDSEYITKLRKLGNQFINDISGNDQISLSQKDTIISLIDNYLHNFSKMVMLDEKIGIRTSSGLKYLLESKEQKIQESLTNMLFKANMEKDAIFMKMERYYIVYFILIFLISITISFLISNRITAPLSTLTSHIQLLIESDFKLKDKPVFKKTHYEIEVLYSEFHKMIAQLSLRDKQRDEAEHALRMNEIKYRQLADMLPQCVFETNEVGNFSYVNKTWMDTFGYTLQEVKDGLNLIEVIKSDNMNAFVEGKEFNFREFTGQRKDGSTFAAVVYSNPRKANNAIIGYTGIIIDNTERKKYIDALEREKKKAEESDKLKSAFLANMSHEIRTPMNSIIGFTNLLTMGKKMDKQQEEYLGYISQNGDMLLHLIDDIIDFAKIEAGELTIRKQDCNLNKMMDDLASRFKETLRLSGKSDIKLQLIKGVPGAEYNINTDPHRLNQILTNILSNAVKFTEKGSVEFGYELASASRIIFFIKDTGIGIDKKDQKIVFQRFRQVDGSLMRKYGGTGLGLAITKNLVELMKGKISIESELNKGTSFFIELPVTAGTKMKQNDDFVMDQNVQIDWLGKKILIAEDNSASFTFLKEMLSSTGVQIIRAHNGQEAVEIADSDREIEIILMDMQMPVMSGYDASRRIKQIRPELPIIAQTAYALAGEKEKTLEAGCDDYISKPINMSLLISKISYFFVRNDSAYANVI